MLKDSKFEHIGWQWLIVVAERYWQKNWTVEVIDPQTFKKRNILIFSILTEQGKILEEKSKILKELQNYQTLAKIRFMKNAEVCYKILISESSTSGTGDKNGLIGIFSSVVNKWWSPKPRLTPIVFNKRRWNGLMVQLLEIYFLLNTFKDNWQKLLILEKKSLNW